ncbi:hypothetical protein SeMB42_g06907 [Synchytrium endobioticum]|uniref:Uncharacterized protein n=1 Tax=Synchytrium endobioticum TaxID=286115 RepID=A0A507C736_9FUNG|nr:hypothetical protein SeMB42_g06907 [Synchytrium endobioticum]
MSFAWSYTVSLVKTHCPNAHLSSCQMDHSTADPPLTPSFTTPTCACACHEKLRLAAEIGQALLRKNEDYENTIRALQSQLHDHVTMRMELDDMVLERDRVKQQINTLQSQLDTLETQHRRLMQDYEEQAERLKTMQESASRADDWKNRAAGLEADVAALQKLADHADEGRTTIESKYRRLTARVVELRTSNEQLRNENQVLQTSQDRLLDGTRSQNGIKHVNSTDTCNPNGPRRGSEEKGEALAGQCQTLMALVRELTTANHNLKEELAEVKDTLASTQDELVQLGSNHASHGIYLASDSLSEQIFRSCKTSPDVLPSSCTFSSGDTASNNNNNNNNNRTTLESSDILANTMAGKHSSSMSSKPSDTDIADSVNQTALQTYTKTLTTLAAQLHVRIKSSDPVILNRRLRRAFDIKEITTLSNNIIESVLGDVQRLSLRFPTSPSEEADEADVQVLQGLVVLVQSLLDNIASSRSTLNEYALSYVERMEEASKRASASDISNGLVKSEPPTPSASSFNLPFLFGTFTTPSKPIPSTCSSRTNRHIFSGANDLGTFDDVLSTDPSGQGAQVNKTWVDPISFWTR